MRRRTSILMVILSAALTLGARVHAAPDVSGKWTIDGDVQGNAVALKCDVQQNADAKVSGKCDVNGMETVDLAGDVTDTTLKFAITVQGYTLTYTGKLEGDTVSGDIEVAGTGGTFSGKRAK